MPTTLAPVDVCNIALSKIGAQAIVSLLDTSNASAVACNNNLQLAYLEVTRSGRWNCLLRPAVLQSVPQIPLTANQSLAPGSYVTWTANTLFTQGVYVTYGGYYYLVLNTYTSSSSVATDVANGNLSLYNSNGPTITNATAWAPLTFYPANAFLFYGNYYYEVNFSYTSTNNFTNDLTAGYLTQTDQQYGSSSTDFLGPFGLQYASGWPYQYLLPADFQLLAILNENAVWDYDGSGGDDYELMSGQIAVGPPPTYGQCLFTYASQAVIQYVPNQPDTTQWDALFTNAVTLKLASAIATTLRQDGGALEAKLLMAYEQALRVARQKNGGEKQSIRFNPIRSSRFNQARYGGING